ncbi:MAG: low molecular weight phosphotyrosine protein phosphatase [Paludibacteraceae bacterium]|nr:low molecular weight phosphotyrosine protein phosphatase [Paludibacteraceae bacterium]
MIRILFVCHGNICRSPMAEFVMKHLVAEQHLDNQFEIASAATSTEEIGNPVYPPARRELNSHGIECNGHHARQMTTDDYDYYNYIIAMDHYNLRNMQRFVGNDSERKVSLLMDWTDNPHDVADPWYTGDFRLTWQDIWQSCNAIFTKLK